MAIKHCGRALTCALALSVLTFQPTSGSAADAPSTYLLGPEDTISVVVPEAEELSFADVRIGPDGMVRLPQVGALQASGLTVTAFEAELERRLGRYMREPQAIVTVGEFQSQPVSVLGAVREPGVYQLRGRKRLVEMLSLAGGIGSDAGAVVKITRRGEWGDIPLPGAVRDGDVSVAEADLTDLMAARAPEHDVAIMPQDVISVPRAELVYVVGAVLKAGAFPLTERDNVSVLQALAMAGGLAPAAKKREARILRAAEDEDRVEIAVNLKDVIAGRAADPPLSHDDILFIPDNGGKALGMRAIQTLVSTASGIAVWRVGNSR